MELMQALLGPLEFRINIIDKQCFAKNSIFNRCTTSKYNMEIPKGNMIGKKKMLIDDSLVILKLKVTKGLYPEFVIKNFKIDVFRSKSNAILVVIEMTNKSSLHFLDNLLPSVKSFSPNKFIILVGNNCDIGSEVSSDELQEKALLFGLTYVGVSAKSCENIDFLLEIITRELLERYKNKIQENE